MLRALGKTFASTKFAMMSTSKRLGACPEEGVGPVDLFGGVRLSREPDYFSIAGLFQPTVWLADRATMFRCWISYRHDEIGQNFRGGSQQRPGNEGGTSAEKFRETLDAISAVAGWEQALTRTLVFGVGYDFTYQQGFLANPYRSVLGGQRPEEHPDQRFRHLLFSRLAWYIPRSRTSLQALYRSYVDNWKVTAINPEVRVYQEMSPFFQTRLRYRYYKQTAAYFYKADPNDYTFQDPYVTADPKLSAFRVHEAGIQFLVTGGFLEGKRHRSLAGAQFDISFNYRWNTNAFGNQVVAQTGLRIPF